MPSLTERFGDAYRAQLQAFADGIRTNEPPAVSGLDSLAALEIGIAATQSYKTGRSVTLKGPGFPVGA
jgi:predicted dehydrogenase